MEYYKVHEEKRERPTVGKKEGGQGVEEREEGEAWRPDDAPGVLFIGQGKQEVAMGAPGSSTQQLPELNDEDKEDFANCPWLWRFSRKRTKQPKIWYKNHVFHLFKLLKTPGLFC
jgi:hypothetical protein